MLRTSKLEVNVKEPNAKEPNVKEASARIRSKCSTNFVLNV